MAECPGDSASVFELAHSHGAKAHRAAGIDDQAASQVGVGLELLDEESVRPAEGSPVEPPQVIAGHIFSILGELDARTAMRARVPARDVAQHRPPRQERKARQPRQNCRIQKTTRAALGKHRETVHRPIVCSASVSSISLRTIFFESIPSA